MTIKAIETRYNGYRFRSRLEARWAVFLDSLGIAYEYEKEGFALDGCFYLPDFWLPVWRTWVEVKSAAAAWAGDWQPCQSLALAGSPIMMLVGEYTCGDHDRCPRVNEQNGLLHAYEAARSARFEHGETPRPR